MFVNLFIGNPPSKVDSNKKNEETFSLETISNNKLILCNNINKRWLTFQKMPEKIISELVLNQSEYPAYIMDHDNDICLGFGNCASIPGFHEKVTYDYVNLNPRFTRFYPDDVENDTDISQIFVNIDTSVFTPLLYEIPDGAYVKDAYHYGGHYYGFILEVKDIISATEAARGLKIYGYDNRIPNTHEMACFHMYEVAVDCRFATSEELEEIQISDPVNFNSEYKYTKNVVTISHSGMNKEERKKFFRMRSMYQKSNAPRTVHLTGPLFTTHIIGTTPTKAARELIVQAKEVNLVPSDMEYHYHYIPRDKFKDETDWYENGIVPQLNALGNKKIRAVSVTDDIKVKIRDVRKPKIQQILSLHEDGTITSVLSNR